MLILDSKASSIEAAGFISELNLVCGVLGEAASAALNIASEAKILISRSWKSAESELCDDI